MKIQIQAQFKGLICTFLLLLLPVEIYSSQGLSGEKQAVVLSNNSTERMVISYIES